MKQTENKEVIYHRDINEDVNPINDPLADPDNRKLYKIQEQHDMHKDMIRIDEYSVPLDKQDEHVLPKLAVTSWKEITMVMEYVAGNYWFHVYMPFYNYCSL